MISLLRKCSGSMRTDGAVCQKISETLWVLKDKTIGVLRFLSK